jgi:hypothetical protein
MEESLVMADRLARIYAGNHPVDAYLARSRCVDRGFRVELFEPERSEGGMLGARPRATGSSFTKRTQRPSRS